MSDREQIERSLLATWAHPRNRPILRPDYFCDCPAGTPAEAVPREYEEPEAEAE